MRERDVEDARPRADPVGVPGPIASVALLVVLGLGFWGIGAFSPTVLPEYADRPRQVLGMALMLSLLPAYIPFAAWLGQRRSLALVHELRPRLTEPDAADEACEAIRTGLRRRWPGALGLGLILGLFNTNPIDAVSRPSPELALSLSLGQLVLWILVGMLFAVRLPVCRAFRRLAETAPIDLLRPEQQRPIARSGLIDIAIIAGALLFTPLQSLDAEFRWFNYRFGLLVALPSAVFFLLWPLQPMHRRNREDRERRLAEVDRQLAPLLEEPPKTAESSQRLEALLAHRDRLQSARSWPLSTDLLSRVLLYLVAPPLAWAGAALVERVIDRLLN